MIETILMWCGFTILLLLAILVSILVLGAIVVVFQGFIELFKKEKGDEKNKCDSNKN